MGNFASKTGRAWFFNPLIASASEKNSPTLFLSLCGYETGMTGIKKITPYFHLYDAPNPTGKAVVT